MNRWTTWGVGLALALIGCAGPTGPITGESLTEADALPVIAEVDWARITEGCEGMLYGDVSFGIAQNAPELVAAAREGDWLCIDSFSAVESELEDIGSDLGDTLWLGYIATLQETEALSYDQNSYTVPAPPIMADFSDKVAGDPQPQPSLEGVPVPTVESNNATNADTSECETDCGDQL